MAIFKHFSDAVFKQKIEDKCLFSIRVFNYAAILWSIAYFYEFFSQKKTRNDFFNM